MREVMFTMRLPSHLKRELQELRFRKNVKMSQIIFALLKTAEKNRDDFEYYLWLSSKV